MDLLLETGLIQPGGQKEVPGRPTLWTITPSFLAHFGLRSIRDLPGGAELTLSDFSRALGASATGNPGTGGRRGKATLFSGAGECGADSCLDGLPVGSL